MEVERNVHAPNRKETDPFISLGCVVLLGCFPRLCSGVCYVQDIGCFSVHPGHSSTQSGDSVIIGPSGDHYECNSRICFPLSQLAPPVDFCNDPYVNQSFAVELQNICFSYPAARATPALSGITLTVGEGEIFGFLGPNGSGKTTLFRILSTLLTPTSGKAQILGMDLATSSHSVRANIGVVFQKHSLDQKLTISENLNCYGHLYGMRGLNLKKQVEAVLYRFDLSNRAKQLVETLSEGLKRRVELAKAFLHRPRVLVLDEPTVGLDPRARLEFWKWLKVINQSELTTILATTHLMDEAENCYRLAFLNHGELVAMDSPFALKELVRGDVINIRSQDVDSLCTAIRNKLEMPVSALGGTIRIECQDGHKWIPRLVESFPGQIDEISLSRPTLEDVFIHVTGTRFESIENGMVEDS
jgi:ABC-2 type transport system ATP-binding protein